MSGVKNNFAFIVRIWSNTQLSSESELFSRKNLNLKQLIFHTERSYFSSKFLTLKGDYFHKEW